jgi:hypothetical protein
MSWMSRRKAGAPMATHFASLRHRLVPGVDVSPFIICIRDILSILADSATAR